jgi:hypothetical protein
MRPLQHQIRVVAQVWGMVTLSKCPNVLEAECRNLIQAYMKYVAPEYPIIHSRRLRVMHARRNMLHDTWEVAVLHFVYAIAGSSLQLVYSRSENSPSK